MADLAYKERRGQREPRCCAPWRPTRWRTRWQAGMSAPAIERTRVLDYGMHPRLWQCLSSTRWMSRPPEEPA